MIWYMSDLARIENINGFMSEFVVELDPLPVSGEVYGEKDEQESISDRVYGIKGIQKWMEAVACSKVLPRTSII